MKRIVFLLCCCILSQMSAFAQNKTELSPYVDFLQRQQKSAKEYILDLFQTHDMVVICERDHSEFSQYDLFLDIIRDERFINNVGNIFTEIGLSTLNPGVNSFLQTKGLSVEEQQKRILEFHRDLETDPIWDRYNYSYLLQNLYDLNNQQPHEKAINLYPSGVPIVWRNLDSSNCKQTIVSLLRRRDSIMAAQIIHQFDGIQKSAKQNKKALVIMNYRHAFNRDILPPGAPSGYKGYNATSYLFDHYKGKIANVYLYGMSFDEKEQQKLLQQGKWDAAFKMTGNKNVGFDFAKSPFGKDSFDLWMFPNQYDYQDIFSGLVFYNPIEDQRTVNGIPNFIDASFIDEFFRRWQLYSMVLPVKKFSKDEIDIMKRTPDNDLIKRFNYKHEKPYPDLNKLFKARDQWLH